MAADAVQASFCNCCSFVVASRRSLTRQGARRQLDDEVSVVRIGSYTRAPALRTGTPQLERSNHTSVVAQQWHLDQINPGNYQATDLVWTKASKHLNDQPIILLRDEITDSPASR